MIKLRMLSVILVLGFFLMPFGGLEPTHQVAAEPDGPPTLSSEGFKPPELPKPPHQPTIVPGLARDDYIPPESASPLIEPDGFSPQQVPLSATDSDSDLATSINAVGIVLYDNGPLVTHLGGGYGGADASVFQTGLGMLAAGFPSNPPINRVTDDFEVSDPAGWQVNALTFFAYQYATHPYPPVSTLTGVYLQIWNGKPDLPDSEVIFGDLVSNRMTSTSWTGIYRVPDTEMAFQLCPIMKIEAQVGKKLSAGTYWLDWAITGSLPNGPRTPPISILGQTITGNALVTYDAGVNWQDATDTGIETQPKQGLPFIVRGYKTAANVLYDNGPLITHPGAGYNSTDASVFQSSIGLNNAGFQSKYPDHRMADDFVVSAPEGWQVDSLTFFAYHYDTYAYPPVSTLTGVYLQIWNGQPDLPGSQVIFGDMVTNRMTSTAWAGSYRVPETEMVNQKRPIMKIEANVGKRLSPGTYWLEWTLNGTGDPVQEPMTIPISILGQTTTGNALHTFNGGQSWQDVIAAGAGTPQGLPFIISGSLGTWLWHQPVSTVNTLAYLDQEFSDLTTQSTYLSDDFIVDNIWMVQSIFVPGSGWYGFTTLLNSIQLNWKIYTDNGGVPSGDPSEPVDTSIWSLSLFPTDPKVTISNGSGGLPSNTSLSLGTTLILNPGHYWLVFYPTMAFDPFGRFGRQPADSINGYACQYINPSGGFGDGTVWRDWAEVFSITQHDIAFSIGGSWLHEIFLPLITR